jgi:hypothetical protein
MTQGPEINTRGDPCPMEILPVLTIVSIIVWYHNAELIKQILYCARLKVKKRKKEKQSLITNIFAVNITQLKK